MTFFHHLVEEKKKKKKGGKENRVGGDTKCYPPKNDENLEIKFFSYVIYYFTPLITIISYVIKI
jgi:hypothetical protein